MSNLPYSSSQKTLVPKNSNGPLSRKTKIITTTTILTFPTSEAKLLAFVIRQIFNGRVLSSFNKIRNERKKKFHMLKEINGITERRLMFGFSKISSYGMKVKS
jgi:hypothetical protein